MERSTNSSILVVTNFSKSEEEFPHGIKIFLFTLILIIALLIIGLNLLTIIVVVKYRILRKTTNILIISLTIADLLMGLHLAFCSSMEERKKSSKNLCLVCINEIATNLLTSLSTACGIAIERYLAIVHPFFFEVNITTKKIVFGAMLIWIYATIFANSNWISNKLAHQEDFVSYSRYSCRPIHVHEKWFDICILIHCLFILILCSYLYYKIYVVAVDHVERIHALNSYKPELKILEEISPLNSQETEKTGTKSEDDDCVEKVGGNKNPAYRLSSTFSTGSGSEPNGHRNVKEHLYTISAEESFNSSVIPDKGDGEIKGNFGNTKTDVQPEIITRDSQNKEQGNAKCTECLECRKHKIAKMTSLVLAVMLICLIPYISVTIIDVFLDKADNVIFSVIQELCLYLLFANSFINPLLYSYRMKDFRRAYKDLLSFKKWKCCS